MECKIDIETGKNEMPHIPPGKLPCLYCGRPILPVTAERNNGYCMFHRHDPCDVWSRGEIVLQSQFTQEQVKKRFEGHEKFPMLLMLFKMMEMGDRLFEFTANPTRIVETYAAKGIVLVRKESYRAEVVLKWKSNDLFYKDWERSASEKEVAHAFGARWNEVKATLPEGVHYIYFESSPHAFFRENKDYAIYKIMFGSSELSRVHAFREGFMPDLAAEIEKEPIQILGEVQNGANIEDVCRHHCISRAGYDMWKLRYGGMDFSDGMVKWNEKDG